VGESALFALFRVRGTEPVFPGTGKAHDPHALPAGQAKYISGLIKASGQSPDLQAMANLAVFVNPP
jgi:hypothetical protein